MKRPAATSMKRPAASTKKSPRATKAKKQQLDDPLTVRKHLFEAGTLFPSEQYSGPQKFVLGAPGYGKFKNAKPLELYYFAIRALGQLQQLCCEIAGHPYTYTVMLVPYFQQNMKQSLEFGRLPMVRTVDKGELVQSKAVLRYVAQRVGMAGKNVSEVARCDMWSEMLDSEAKLDDEALKKLNEMEALPDLTSDIKSISRRDTMSMSEEQKAGNALKFWDDVIGKSKSGYIMPFCSYVDVSLFWTLRSHPALLEKCGCSKLKAYVEKIERLPGFQRMVTGMRIMPAMTQPGYVYTGDDLASKP